MVCTIKGRVPGSDPDEIADVEKCRVMRPAEPDCGVVRDGTVRPKGYVVRFNSRRMIGCVVRIVGAGPSGPDVIRPAGTAPGGCKHKSGAYGENAVFFRPKTRNVVCPVWARYAWERS